MRWIRITNQGLVDPQALSLMGVSTKSDDGKTIGMFGSGNKYALALLLRQNIPFMIFSGNKPIEVETKTIEFRGTEHQQIYIDGQQTSLTTSMGPHWEPWYALREIYANALDEGDATLSIVNTAEPLEDKTTIYIGETAEFMELFNKPERYLLGLANRTVLDSCQTHYGEVTFYEGLPGEFVCYRKGIRIMPKNKFQSLWSYDFERIEINESRTYKYEHAVKERIASALAVCENKSIIKEYLTNRSSKYENVLYWGNSYVNDKLSQAWHVLLHRQRVYPEDAAIDSGDYEGKHNSYIVPRDLAQKIADEIPSCDVIGINESEVELVEPTKEEQSKLNQAMDKLKTINIEIAPPVKVGMCPQDDVNAVYDTRAKEIIITRQFLSKCTVQGLMGTLVEEQYHHQGYNDGQRAMVMKIIDDLINTKQEVHIAHQVIKTLPKQ